MTAPVAHRYCPKDRVKAIDGPRVGREGTVYAVFIAGVEVDYPELGIRWEYRDDLEPVIGVD